MSRKHGRAGRLVFAFGKILSGFGLLLFSLNLLSGLSVGAEGKVGVIFAKLLLLLGVAILRKGFTVLYWHLSPGTQDGGKRSEKIYIPADTPAKDCRLG